MATTTKHTKAALESDLNARLYAAAEKAGMVDALRSAQAEVHASCMGGVWNVYLGYEAEMAEVPGWVYPKAAMDRAHAWLVAAAARIGIKAY